MKIKDFLKNCEIPEIRNIPMTLDPHIQTIGMKQALEVDNQNFDYFDEFKGKNIEIIDVKFDEPTIKITENGVEFECKSDPELITIELYDNFDMSKFNNIIKLYSIFIQNDELIIRCSKDSINL